MRLNTLAIYCLLSLIVLAPLNLTGDPLKVSPQKTIDLQGHRGARGLLPENTIPAFLHALDLGVTTLEMDVVVNAQGTVILSHETWISAQICSHPDGSQVTEEEEKDLKIFTMNDAEVTSYDCGSRGHPDFPRQQAMAVSKPSLVAVLQSVEAHKPGSGVKFNIEIKSRPDFDHVFHPGVTDYAQALYNVLQSHGVLERASIQSFDPRALEAVHRIDRQVTTVLLVANEDGFQTNLDQLSFVADIYSPYFKLVDKDLIRAAHAQGMQVIPWTVNDVDTMNHLIDIGVDGLITDYPDLGAQVLRDR